MVLEKSARGARTRPEVSGDHEEPGSQICHSGEYELRICHSSEDYLQLNFLFISLNHTKYVLLSLPWDYKILYHQSSGHQQEQRKAENEGVTEDDVNEIKNDISAFRQLLDCLPNFT